MIRTLLRKDVCELLGVTSTTLNRWEKSKEMRFPARFHIGESNVAWRKVYYLYDEVEAWIEAHVPERARTNR